MDWTASGITNVLEYELVSTIPPYTNIGWLEGVTGGKICRKVGASYRESMSLDIDGEEPPASAMVRVWHTASLEAETIRSCLGTFMLDGANMEYSAGRYHGSMSYQSTLLRHGTDLRGNNRNVQGGTNVLQFAESVVINSGGLFQADPSVSTSKTFGTTHVWEFGESALDELQRCADALGAIIGVDPYGTVTMTPYLLPAQRARSWILTTDALLEGLRRGDPDTVNIVHVDYTPSGSQAHQFASSRLDEGQAMSRGTIGRWAARTYKLTELSAGSVQAQADRYMAQADTGHTWECTAPYIPLEIGSRGALVYQDGGAGIVRDSTIESIEIQLDTAMRMALVLREV